jgi:hypothetical protein
MLVQLGCNVSDPEIVGIEVEVAFPKKLPVKVM